MEDSNEIHAERNEDMSNGGCIEQSGIITFDVGGRIFRILRKTLCRLPNTKLAQLATHIEVSEYVSAMSEPIFIDRSPENFEQVMNYYRYGLADKPTKGSVFRQMSWNSDMAYYGLTDLRLVIDMKDSEDEYENDEQIDDTPPKHFIIDFMSETKRNFERVFRIVCNSYFNSRHWDHFKELGSRNIKWTFFNIDTQFKDGIVLNAFMFIVNGGDILVKFIKDYCRANAVIIPKSGNRPYVVHWPGCLSDKTFSDYLEVDISPD